MKPWQPDGAFWRDRPVAVTGATGFLGSHVTDLLLRLGADVVALVRDDVPDSPIKRAWSGAVSEVRGTVNDQAVVERLLGVHRARTVLHLAAQSQVGVANRNPVTTLEANVAGTWTVLEAVRRSPAVEQIVIASSDRAYGTQPELPYDEDMPLRAVNPYDVSKACADLISSTYYAVFGTPICVTRCGNFFGPGDANWARLVPGTVRSLLLGERPVIRSDGTMVRDYLYVVDGALAYLQLVEAMANDPSLCGQAFNFSAETPLTVLELVERIQKAAGTDLTPDIQATASHEINALFLSAAKAHRVLDWWPQFSLDEGLALTVDWYRDHALGPA